MAYSLKQLRRIVRLNNKGFNEYCLKVFNNFLNSKKKHKTRKVVLVYLLNFSGNFIKIEKISGSLISYRRSVYTKDVYIVVRKMYRSFFVDVCLNLNSPTFYHLEII